MQSIRDASALLELHGLEDHDKDAIGCAASIEAIRNSFSIILQRWRTLPPKILGDKTMITEYLSAWEDLNEYFEAFAQENKRVTSKAVQKFLSESLLEFRTYYTLQVGFSVASDFENTWNRTQRSSTTEQERYELASSLRKALFSNQSELIGPDAKSTRLCMQLDSIYMSAMKIQSECTILVSHRTKVISLEATDQTDSRWTSHIEDCNKQVDTIQAKLRNLTAAWNMIIVPAYNLRNKLTLAREEKAFEIAMKLAHSLREFLCHVGGSMDFVENMTSLRKLLFRLGNFNLSEDIIQDGGYPVSSGGQADVYQGTDTRDGKRVAIKRIRVSKATADEPKTIKASQDDCFPVCDHFLTTIHNRHVQRLSRELRVWSGLRHSNILLLKGFTVDDGSEELFRLAFVSEWMDKGSLYRYIRREPKFDALSITEGIAKGLHYLHTEEVVHADIKSENVLMTPEGTPLLADFGISHLVASIGTRESATTAAKGTLRWMSPELLYSESAESEQEVPVVHTKASDIWAFGMTVLEILTKNVPYADLKQDSYVLGAIAKGELPSEPKGKLEWTGVKKGLWDVCRSFLWEKAPDKRVTAIDVLELLQWVRDGDT